MRNGTLALVLGVLALPFEPAAASVVIPRKGAAERAFRAADYVLTVEPLSEDYVSVPGEGTLRAGIAKARVIEMHKGRPMPATIVYRVIDGEDSLNVPAFRSTHPGHRYKLYLKLAPDGGPLLILYREPPTD